MVLQEKLLDKSEFNCEWKPQVNNLCFNSFGEEMKYLGECIGKDESVEDLVSLDGQLGVLSSNDKGRDELLQQKESTQSLISEDNNLIGEETVMSYEREFVPGVDKENLVYSKSQSKGNRQTFGTVTEVRNQNSILTKMDATVSQRILFSDKEEGNHKNEDEAIVYKFENETKN